MSAFSVSVATGYRLDNQGVGVRVPVGSRVFCLPSLRTHRDAYPIGIEGSFPGVKKSVHETDHTFSTSAEVKKKCDYIHPPYVFMV
jgi:hypothetical protein